VLIVSPLNYYSSLGGRVVLARSVDWAGADPVISPTTTDLNLRHVTIAAQAREPTTLISISSVNKQSAPDG